MGTREELGAGDNKAWLERPFLGTAKNWEQKGDREAL